MSLTNSNSLQFRPASLKDFSRSAKNLAAAINLPQQKAQELLARAYGYSNLHELQMVLRSSGKSGPFDNDQTPEQGLVIKRAAARQERLQKLIAESHPLNPRLDGLFRSVDMLALFSTPPEQRRAQRSLTEAIRQETNLPALPSSILDPKRHVPNPHQQTSPAYLKRPGMWLGCFPEVFDAILSPADAVAFGADGLMDDDADDFIRPIARVCSVRIERVSAGGKPKELVQAKLQALTAFEPTENWNARNYDFVGFIHQSDTTATEPVGFFTFCLSTETTKKGLINEVHFGFDLIFLRPDARGRGLGQMACAAIGQWLRNCKVYGELVTKAGVTVDYSCEVWNKGSAECSRIIFSHFEMLMEGLEDGMTPHESGWNIRRLGNHEDYELGV